MPKRIAACASTGVCVIVLLSGCTSNPSDAPASTTTSIDFPYPPQHDILEIAVPLDPYLSEAARFAMDADQAAVMAVFGEPDLVRHYQGTIAKELWRASSIPPKPGLRTTGGDTYKVVRATPSSADQVEVDVCSYSVPGVYGIERSGREMTPNLSPNAYGLSRMTVEKTTRESADGAKPPEPRWLVTNDWIKVGLDPDQTYQVCGPFKPDPWVQKMPDPTESPIPATK